MLLRLASLTPLLLLAACAGGACGLTKRAELPLSVAGQVLVVDATINGSPARLVLDTGASSTLLTEEAASRRHLVRDPTHLPQIVGVGGRTTRWGARIDKLALGPVVMKNERVEVGSTAFLPDGKPPDGFLGADLLSRYALDLDTAHLRLTIYEGKLCPGPPPGWAGQYAALPLSTPSPGRMHVGLPAVLNGQRITALLDTGAAVTTVTNEAAASVGVTALTLEQDRAVGMVGSGSGVGTAHLHRFRSLDVAGQVYQGPLLAVAPLPVSNAEMLLGMDWISSRRLFLSYATHQLFVESPSVVESAPSE